MEFFELADRHGDHLEVLSSSATTVVGHYRVGGLSTEIQCIDADGIGGTVASQDPRGGAEVTKGTTVTLKVNGLRAYALPCMR